MSVCVRERERERERERDRERDREERDRVCGEEVASVLAGLLGKSTYRKDQLTAEHDTRSEGCATWAGGGGGAAGKESPACLQSGSRHRFSRLPTLSPGRESETKNERENECVCERGPATLGSARPFRRPRCAERERERECEEERERRRETE